MMRGNRFGVAGMGLLVLSGVLAGCGSGGPGTGATPSGTPATSSASSRPSTSANPSPPEAAACTSSQLSSRLGTPVTGADGAARVVPLIYTNTSDRPCTLRGAPDVVLHGPASDPNGPDFELTEHDTGTTIVTLPPRGAAVARVTVRTDAPGATGHGGSTDWTPTELVSTPPGETTPLRTPWTAGGTVLREDSSTHPDEYVEPFRPTA